MHRQPDGDHPAAGGPRRSGPEPGAGQNQTGLPFKNFQVSDIPSNMDYAFRAGIFIGDYNNVAIADTDNKAYYMWIDARNGRSSGGPAGGVTNPSQPGRNPLCEQSDVFIDSFGLNGGGDSGKADKDDALFLVTPCPEAMKDKNSN